MPKIANRAGINDRVKNKIYGIIDHVKKYRNGENMRASVGFTTDQSDSVESELMELAGIIHDGLEEIDRINARIRELLSLGKIEPSSFTKVDLVEIVEKAIDFSQVHFMESNVQTDNKISTEHLEIRGDTDRLLQLIENLMLDY